jgi:hypothetical protein
MATSLPHCVELQILQFYVRAWYRTDRHVMILSDRWILLLEILNESIIFSSSFKLHKNHLGDLHHFLSPSCLNDKK